MGELSHSAKEMGKATALVSLRRMIDQLENDQIEILSMRVDWNDSAFAVFNEDQRFIKTESFTYKHVK